MASPELPVPQTAQTNTTQKGVTPFSHLTALLCFCHFITKITLLALQITKVVLLGKKCLSPALMGSETDADW